MEDQIIFIYSLCDDLLASFGTNKDAQNTLGFVAGCAILVVSSSHS